ncbi:MAG: PaaI family thioesterase [Marinagarivorans sp.]|nr:PaaI family thioesterase [Marinagarivorans sp.]
MMIIKYLPDLTMLSIISQRMMRKIKFKKRRAQNDIPELGDQLIPPGVTSSVFNGFVTSINNQYGLQLKIHHEKNGGVACEWETARKFEGYPQTLHGGISFAILDELLAYAIFERYRTFAVTLSSKTQWLGRVKIGSKITAKAIVIRRFWRFVKVQGYIYNHKNHCVVSMAATFYIPSKAEFGKLIDINLMPEEALPHCGI